jgi:hypothetical protein
VSVPGLGGAFSYLTVGEPLLTEYRNFHAKLPSYRELAKYIFYTETSREIVFGRVDEEAGFIGSTEPSGGTSYYLFYTPNEQADREMSLKTLAAILERDPNRNWVIYCEKIWVHPEDLVDFQQEHGKRVRPMLVPFNLR